MIHYHGTPITPDASAVIFLKCRHAIVSFAHSQQIELVAEVCQSFALDNGAFSFWKSGTPVDWIKYLEWVGQWRRHPGFDFAIIPDMIEGTEEQNDALIDNWFGSFSYTEGVPVWHMSESLNRLERLMRFPRIALGSTAMYATVGTPEWWARMSEAMKIVCDEHGRPRSKLHGLRMLNPTIFSYLPLSSADSSNVARNMGLDNRWSGPYSPRSRTVRALILADRIEQHAAASRWSDMIVGPQMNLELLG